MSSSSGQQNAILASRLLISCGIVVVGATGGVVARLPDFPHQQQQPYNYYYFDDGGFDNEVTTTYHADTGKLYERDYHDLGSRVAAEPRVLSNNITGNVLAGLTLFEAPNGALAFIINYGLAVRN